VAEDFEEWRFRSCCARPSWMVTVDFLRERGSCVLAQELMEIEVAQHIGLRSTSVAVSALANATGIEIALEIHHP